MTYYWLGKLIIMRLYKVSLMLCVGSLLAACGGDDTNTSTSGADASTSDANTSTSGANASTSLSSFNLTGIEAGATEGQATFTWDGDSSGITYTVCEKDTTAANNCSSLGQVTGANSLSVTVNSLVSRTASNFFIYASDGTSSAASNELSLSSDVTTSLIQYLKASNSEAGDDFGYRVSLSSDGNTLAVGAPDEGSDDSGAVYVFRYDGNNWSQQASVIASNSEGGDAFGISVSLSSDGNTLAVGASGEDSSATGINSNKSDNSAGNSGAVYVFRYEGSNWGQQAYVKASNTDAGDGFGYSVSLSSEGNTLAVGAFNEGSSGATYVFRYDGGNWSQQAYVKASNAGTDDKFGYSVSLNLDGNTLAIGAPDENSKEGAVYVFRHNGTNWSQQAYVKASNRNYFDNFGRSVSLSSDGNTLAAGAPSESSSATGINGNEYNDSVSYSGAVYVFRYDGSGWDQQAYVKASNTGRWDHFGESVSLSSDGNTLAVGAHYEGSSATGINGTESDDSAGSSGAVYVFRYDGGSWGQQAYVKASNTDANDRFGYSVSLSSESNTLAVGAGSEDSSATGINGNESDNSAKDSGAVYIY